MEINRNTLIGIAAVLSIAVSLIALKSYNKKSNQQSAYALRNSFDAQKTLPAIAWNANDATNPNGLSAYGRNPTLDQVPRIWVGRLGPQNMIPGAAIGGPTGGLNVGG